MYPHADSQLVLVDADEKFMAQRGSDCLDFFDQRPRRCTQNDFLSPSIFDHRLTQNQPLSFQTVEQTRKGRPFDANTLRQLTLRRCFFEARKVQQH